jgi:potassium efflux system protein
MTVCHASHETDLNQCRKDFRKVMDRKTCFDWKILGVLVAIFLGVLSSILTATCYAQPTEIQNPFPTSSETVTNESIDAALQELESTKEIDDATRGSIQQLYQQAKQRLKSAETSAANAAEFERMIQAALTDTAELKRKLASPAEAPSPVSSAISYDELQQRIIAQQAVVAAAKEHASKLTAESARRQARLAELPTLANGVKKELENVVNQLAQPAPISESPLLTKSRLALLRTSRQQLEQNLNELTKEQAAYTATTDLLPLQRDWSNLQAKAAQDKLDELQKAIAARREYEVESLLRDTRQSLANVPAILHSTADENLKLANQFKATSAQIAVVNSELKSVQTKASSLEVDLQTAQSRIDAVGLTDTLGLMLRQKKKDLIKQRNQLKPEFNASETVRQIQVEIFRLEDHSADLVDLTAAANRELDQAGLPPFDPQREELTRQAMSLLEQRQQLLTKMVKAENDLFQARIALNTAKHNYVQDADLFTAYIDKHVLWIRSAPPVMASDIPHAASAVRWLIAPQNWSRTGQEFLGRVVDIPIIYLMIAVGFLLLFFFRWRFRRIILDCGLEAERRGNSDFMPTFNSLLATLFVAITWPALALVIGWTLVSRPQSSDFAAAIGHGLISVGLFVAPVEVLRQVWREKGLATSHFGWGGDLTKFLRRHLRWFFAVAIVTLFVMVVMQYQENEDWRSSLGRYSAVALFLAATVLPHVLLKSNGVVFQRIKVLNPESRFYRFRRAIYVLVVGAPLALALLSIIGYQYTAYELWICCAETGSLAITLLIITGFVTRWLLMHKRRLLRMEALARLESKKAELSKKSEEPTRSAAELAGIELTEEPGAKLSSISKQAREIVTFLIAIAALIGCWWIWREVLPAIGMLDRIDLWSVTIGERVEKITLADVTYALLAVFATFLAIKNMPGLLELIVLRHSSMDSGARYAVTTIFRYIITIIGLMIALSFLKVPWSQYGWLVAAITVGLGFGLQEIVANFVSGIILLLERPVRVGDVVTIDDVTGVVSRIQMRATTVTNWDRQELIVPNKNLITGKLLNWSLSNVVNRLVINVGVAYGTDTDLVHSLLTEVVSANNKVLVDPAPLINFDKFGDSSLNFVVRCYLSGLEQRVNVTHELHSAINEAFRKASISIPFPQHDVHLQPTPVAENIPPAELD